jgi:hypothetical protein
LIAEIRRNSATPPRRRALASAEPIDPVIFTKKIRAALDEAEVFVSRMPTDKLLFIQAGEVVQPDPERLDSYQTHAGQLRGHWPSSGEITSAMFESYKQRRIGEPKP